MKHSVRSFVDGVVVVVVVVMKVGRIDVDTMIIFQQQFLCNQS